jgi:NAD(P)-dependent dehydrogenase (short-subunit alcohol dehydrogenase family)
MLLDMSAFASTKCFADKLKSEIQEIDMLMLNAGALNTSFNLGPEGYEETIQVTVLSTALLALYLLPWVKVAGKGKAYLGFVTSGIHRCVAIDAWPKDDVLQWLSKEENWPCNMYATAKLLEQYVVNEIAKLALNPFGVLVNNPSTIMNFADSQHRDGEIRPRKSIYEELFALAGYRYFLESGYEDDGRWCEDARSCNDDDARREWEVLYELPVRREL